MQANGDHSGGRRRPFSTWVKRLTNFKSGSSSAEDGRHAGSKRNHYQLKIQAKKKQRSKNNNPYPQSGRVGGVGASLPPAPGFNSVYSYSTARSGTRTSSDTSLDQPSSSRRSLRSSVDGRPPPTAGARSMAPTVSTDHEASHSVMTGPSHGGASSLAGTSRTAGGGLDSRRGGDSTFSSPAPSVRSLTTTLTTIQSIGPNGVLGGATTGGTNGAVHTNGNQNQHNQLHTSHSNTTTTSTAVIQFTQPFPSASPASAIPAHLQQAAGTHLGGNPTTYTMAIANNLLTDNASILTLASSSKRRRRRSLDTDASVRAIPPSSLWGGSRESLPLSVLSSNIEVGGSMPGGTSSSAANQQQPPTTPGLQNATTASSSRMGGPAAAERTSIYSATGTAPALPSERNSFYYAKQAIAGTDAVSVRSGLFGHGRAESISESISGGIGGAGAGNGSVPGGTVGVSAAAGAAARVGSALAATTTNSGGSTTLSSPKEREGEELDDDELLRAASRFPASEKHQG